MNYLLISDVLWYTGHILTGSSILFTSNHFYIAIILVVVGQFITIISRPIGRIQHLCVYPNTEGVKNDNCKIAVIDEENVNML